MEIKEIKIWLEQVKEALLAEGFKHTLLQVWKPRQVFGFVKDIRNVWQMHVRGFEDGHLEAEIEISRFFLEHPNTSQPATKELCEILDQYQIPYTFVERPMAPIQSKTEAPGTLTDWRPIVEIMALLAVAGLVAYLISRE